MRDEDRQEKPCVESKQFVTVPRRGKSGERKCGEDPTEVWNGDFGRC